MKTQPNIHDADIRSYLMQAEAWLDAHVPGVDKHSDFTAELIQNLAALIEYAWTEDLDEH